MAGPIYDTETLDRWTVLIFKGVTVQQARERGVLASDDDERTYRRLIADVNGIIARGGVADVGRTL